MRRKKLEKIALERLHDPANNAEQLWGYVFTKFEPIGLCPWDEYDGCFPADYGVPASLDLTWSKERRRQLESGEAKPNKIELAQWRREMCLWKAREQEWENVAVLKPMSVEDDRVEAFEVWLDRADILLDEKDPPKLFGVFDSIDKAKEALRKKYAMC
jgi:hypothetical protein